MIDGLKVTRVNGKIVSRKDKKFLLRLVMYGG